MFICLSNLIVVFFFIVMFEYEDNSFLYLESIFVVKLVLFKFVVYVIFFLFFMNERK